MGKGLGWKDKIYYLFSTADNDLVKGRPTEKAAHSRIARLAGKISHHLDISSSSQNIRSMDHQSGHADNNRKMKAPIDKYAPGYAKHHVQMPGHRLGQYGVG
jgi:hypothetical protein